MSEETTAASEKYKLPPVEYPKMDMPDRPDAGKPEGDIRMGCDGEVYENYGNKDNSFVADPEPGIPRILIGIPVLNFTYEFVESFLRFWTQICTQAKGKIQVGYQFMYRRPVHMAEIQLAETALFNKCTHILFMDDDIYDVTLADLEKLLAADKEVIGGVMYASKFPYAMCVFRRFNTDLKVIDMPSDNSMYRLYEVPCQCCKCGFGLSHWDAKFCPVCGAANDNIIQKADLIPFAFTLMKTSIFAKLKKPWFHCEIEYPTDSWFADRCREAGIQEYAHMGVRLNHNGVSDLTKPHLFNMELEKKKASNNKGIVSISEEDMERHQYMLSMKMKEAENKLRAESGRIITIDPKEEDSNVKSENVVSESIQEEERVEVPS
jgi:hypothetical protein